MKGAQWASKLSDCAVNVRKHCQCRWTRGSVPRRGKVPCSKACVKVPRCHCKLIRIFATCPCQVASWGIVGLPQTCSFGSSWKHGTKNKVSMVSVALASFASSSKPRPRISRLCFRQESLPSELLELWHKPRSYRGTLWFSQCRLRF